MHFRELLKIESCKKFPKFRSLKNSWSIGTFYPPDPIKIGAHMIVYALRVLGAAPESEAMQAGYEVLNRHRMENGRYILTASKSVPAFKAGNVGEANKWVTLYASMAMK